MEWFVVLMPGILLFAVIGGLVYRSEGQRKQLAQAIEAAGWRYVKQSRGFDVEGGDDVPWQLRVRRSRGSSSGSQSRSTVWEIPAPPASGVVLFGPKLPVEIPGLGGSLVQLALRAILGDEAADLADAREVEVGTARFRSQFSVIASDRTMAERLLTPKVEAALFDSGLERVAVLRWTNRLQVRRMEAAASVEEIARFEALGQVLAAADADESSLGASER